ncbi:hypothetical protein MRX96_018266 [Rhipicephalus microplus]
MTSGRTANQITTFGPHRVVNNGEREYGNEINGADGGMKHRESIMGHRSETRTKRRRCVDATTTTCARKRRSDDRELGDPQKPIGDWVIA